MFIYRYEEYQTNSYIIMGDEEINKLRRLIDIKWIFHSKWILENFHRCINFKKEIKQGASK